MADGTVDNLNIQISAEARSAEKSLDSLASTLRKLNKNLTGNISGMRSFSKEIGTMASSLKALNNISVKIPDMSGITKIFNIFKKIDSESAERTAESIKKVTQSLSGLGSANFNDSGINKTVNALNRLFKADFGSFNPNDFKKITDSISTLGSMPDASNNVNRLISSISRLANAGSKTGEAANDIKRLGEQTQLAARELKGIGTISNELNMFVQSIGRLASAGNKTGQTASNLRNLAKETLEFFNVMSKAPKISDNTIRMTQALAQLASAGGRVSTATNTISSAFNKLSSIGGKTLSAMKKVASGIVSAFKQIGNSGKHVDTARFSLGNLLKTAIGFRLGYGVLEFGRQAFELGSSITEVENVVNVAFGNMADKAYEFASTAKEQFGLSELAALNYSGTMMAILNSSGVAQDAAAEMSTTLAGLAGDLASFYNISQDNAWEKIMSGMAGKCFAPCRCKAA